jgi:hypothetical protein
VYARDEAEVYEKEVSYTQEEKERVAKAEGVDGYIVNESFMTRWTDDECEDGVDYHYSTAWAQGGPIIEREGISVATDDVEPWCGFIEDDETNTLFFSGHPLMRHAVLCRQQDGR